MKNKGFTLIELLVVIAIIGVLSSVTLATLNVARAKGADAAIKADLDGIRKQTAIYFDDNGDYGVDVDDDCTAGMFADPAITAALNHAVTTNGSNPAVCYADDGDAVAGTATSWAVAVPLKTNPATYWCIDNVEYADVGTAQVDGITFVASCI
jgi:prepilin-type N-terminal cleavage/methylation domain-containing protein